MKKMVFWGLVLSAVTVMGCGTTKQQVQKNDFSEGGGIFSFKVGNFEVFMLVEAQREGNTGILVGADNAILERYIPKTGFMHSTNVFLIKTPKQIILVDTAVGISINPSPQRLSPQSGNQEMSDPRENIRAQQAADTQAGYSARVITPIIAKMKRLGVEPEQIDTVLITHLHGDHFGGLQKDGAAVFPNAKVYLSKKELEHFTKVQVNQAAVAALAPYGSKVVTFEPANLGSSLSEIIPGFSPIAAYGHTPGHTAFLVENGKDKFLIAGDFLHIGLVQFPVPEISATYDMDGPAAAATRRQLMEYADQHKIPIGGMHIVYPAVGMVEKDGTGFKFVP
jgi:glyoxylase-like metal-dependent hydrolase (beta-lactamase superfamily II)